MLACLVTLTTITALAGDETRLLRFPTIHGQSIVFSYAGDLYQVDASGGVARKLTNHDGYEIFPRFSPDGKTLAFTGQYDGNTEVFLMDAMGGVPKRLSYTATLGRDDIADRMGPNNIVMGWTNSGESVLFRSRKRSFNDFIGSLYTIPAKGGLSEQLPLPRGGFASYSPDDSKLAYNRVFREFRTWKHYRGGMADDIWVYDFASKTVENVTDNKAQDIIPMWHGENIYFASDRTGTMNLFVYETGSKKTRQLTEFDTFDIKFPSLGDKAIVFEQAGFIYRFDLADEKAVKVPIRVIEDIQTSRNGLVSVGDQYSNYEISPDGKRALLGARGDVFTIPVEKGPTRNITQSSGAHERDSKWSPDGKWILYISDRSGEDEIHIRAQDGSGDEQQITSNSNVYMYQPYWSPDSKKILYADRSQTLYYIDIETKTRKTVGHADAWEITNYTWSPDSLWVAYTKGEVETMTRVWLYSLESGDSFPATTGWFISNSPEFSEDGKFLYVVSGRSFRPTYGQTEFNHIYQDMARIYMIALAKDTDSPFKLTSDEVAIAEEKAKEEKEPEKKAKKGKKKKDKKEKAEGDKKEEKKGKKKDVIVKVDKDGLLDRVIALPIQQANYGQLSSTGDSLYYLRFSARDRGPKFLRYDLKAKKETELGSVTGYELSADKKKMIVSMRGRKLAIIDAPKGKVKPTKFIDRSDMEMNLNRGEEWKQIFNESYRQMRDFFYTPNMHGVDWAGMRDRFAPLVEHVNHRNDLTYIIGEMIGELNVGHAYVGGGDRPQPKRTQTGLLGAELERDASGFYKITRILKGESWDPVLHSPIRTLGVNASIGDFIVAVNGEPTDKMTNIYAALVNTVGKQVTLTLNSTASAEGGRDVVVKPIADEKELYYHDWVQDNIRKVSEATDGKVGYIHVPDMGPRGLNEFVKHFYPQLAKKALIVDVRGNGGGNVSPMLIERLRRELLWVSKARNSAPTTDPGGMLLGPMVCLMDEFSASDGDIFPYRFKTYKLGPLIGKRSWGGVVGIRGSLPFVDGGTLNRPEFSQYDPEGKEWLIEGYGVDPDIYVDNDPGKEYAGIDQQLNKGIEVILEELKTKGRDLASPPPPPIKN